MQRSDPSGYHGKNALLGIIGIIRKNKSLPAESKVLKKAAYENAGITQRKLVASATEIVVKKD